MAKQGEFIHRTKKVGGLDRHWMEMGEGHPAVLLHETPVGWHCWSHQMPVRAGPFRNL